ncbi:hypothetical protein IMZ31_19830 (plasmid) [Pontibacillus sp. ALD_SL1]|uniref:hypothetical protein n=1 Tax=Pontibacillus sp. ALD_SL1 TaxID=2777185 RepID=UPI001A9783AB|nr:hypothetical protein [Pontibacillus sp. ALD_SL1]QST02802.1 hypothetical protein IMZ31_19830 [Pontibacillus sp. ALD_SL1]
MFRAIATVCRAFIYFAMHPLHLLIMDAKTYEEELTDRLKPKREFTVPAFLFHFFSYGLVLGMIGLIVITVQTC